MVRDDLFPPLQPYDSGMMDVGEHHRIYWEQSGRADGAPVLFLHGGPGSGTEPRQRQFFDPSHYRIVLFDQRGSGRSEPLASIEHNTTWDLIADIEQLREMLGIERWLIFGGSWGSTLALAYAERHTERCTGLIVRGIWLCTAEEMAWWQHGTQTFFPENWQRFVEYLPEAERGDLLTAYHRRLMHPSPEVHLPAAVAWKSYETVCSTLRPSGTETLDATPHTLAMSREPGRETALLAHGKCRQAGLKDTLFHAVIGRAAHLDQTRGTVLLPGGGGHCGDLGNRSIFMTELVKADKFIPRGGAQDFRLSRCQHGLKHVDIVGANHVQIIGDRGVLIKIVAVFINKRGDQLIKGRGTEQIVKIA